MLQSPPPFVRRLFRDELLGFLRGLVPVIPDRVTLTSWYRNTTENQRVGGHPESQHLLALATDWVGDAARLETFAELAGRRGLVPILEGDHLHIQAFRAGALSRLMRQARGVDVAINQALTGNPRTLSAEMGMRIESGIATDAEHALCNVLDMFERDHCAKSWARAQ